MRYAVGVSNSYEGKVAVFIVDAPTPLLSLKGVVYDLVKCDPSDISVLEDKESLDQLAREYDLSISDPIPVHENTPLVLPNPDFFDDCDLPPIGIMGLPDDNFDR